MPDGLTLGDLADPTDGYHRDLPVRSVGIDMVPIGPDQVGLAVVVTPEES